MRSIGITVAGLALAAGVGLAGCGGGNGNASGNDNGSSGSESKAAVKDSATVKVSDSSLGRILVDGSGRTLYLFTQDGENTNSMNCDAACLKLWPPLEDKPKAGAGVDAGLIGTTKGGDKTQATYAGHPLYYYAKDKGPGDLKGQGIDKIWYVLDPQGAAVKSAAPSTPSSDNGNSNGNDNGGSGY
jgi:predicted lipoprotein with Yx(FWY)xxD motif